jgi:hypothetical protein
VSEYRAALTVDEETTYAEAATMDEAIRATENLVHALEQRNGLTYEGTPHDIENGVYTRFWFGPVGQCAVTVAGHWFDN